MTENNTAGTGRGLLLVSMDVDPDFEDELNRWYNLEHIPERRDLPGFLSARRFVAVTGGPKYVAMYDLRDPEVLREEPYQRIAGPTEWTKRVLPHIRSNRAVYREIIVP